MLLALLILGCGSHTDAPVSEPVSEPAPKPSLERAPEPTAQASAPKPPAPAPAGISQLSDTRWQVTQALVERWKDHPDELGRVRREGSGYALVNLRQRDAYHLGMRNGDVIVEVNGHGLGSQLELLGAWLDLKNDTKFDVAFLRDGERMTHRYVIR